MSVMQPSLELRARVLAAVQAHPSRPRTAGSRRRWALMAVSVVFMAPVSMSLGGPGLRGRPVGYVIAVSACCLALAAAASWAGVASGGSMLGRPRSWRMAAAIATPMGVLAASMAIGRIWPQMLHEATARQQHVLSFVAPPQVVCLVATPLFGLGPLIFLALTRRQSDPIAPRLSGAALGAAAGAWAAFAIALHCGRGSVHHVVIGHVVPVLALTLIGVLVGDRIVAIRARAGEDATSPATG